MTALALTFAITAGNAFEATLDRRALEQAIDIGQSRIEQIRTRFHAPYRTLVGVAPVDYIETIAPFRRVALAAEAHARAGRRIFGQLEAQQALADAPDEVVLEPMHPRDR